MDKNVIDIKILAKDIASQTIKGIRDDIKGLDKTSKESSKGMNILTGAVAGVTASLTNLGISIIQSGFQALTDFIGGSVDAATEFQKSMTTLEIIAPRFNVAADEAKQAAAELGKELRIGVGPAAETLQNLLKGGLNLEQSRDLMKRFTNEAITGKSSSISLAQAVQNLSFAYTTNNSALGNLSGISENFSDITDRGREALVLQGMKVEDITDDMAKYRGMIDLTNLTMGSAEKFTGTYIDKQAELNLKFQEAQTQLGTALLPILSEVLDFFNVMFDEIGPELKPIVDQMLPELTKLFKEDLLPDMKELVPQVAELVKDFIEFGIENGPAILSFFKGIAEESMKIADRGKQIVDTLTDMNRKGNELGRSFDIFGLEKLFKPEGGMNGGEIRGYNTGGFVSGPRIGTGRDNILVRAEEGEVILNERQQSNIMKQLDQAKQVSINMYNEFSNNLSVEQVASRLAFQIGGAV